LTIEKPPTSKLIDSETKKLWEDCLIEIKLNILPLYFQKYFKTTQIYSFKDDILTIAVPDQFTRKLMIEKYRGLIEKTLTGIRGSQTLVDFCVLKG